MANTIRRADESLWVRPGQVRFGADIRSSLKDALIDVASDQNRPLKHVVDDALAQYAREHWQREEPCGA